MLQIKALQGATAGICQELSGLAAVVTSHQQEASRGAPAHMFRSSLLQLVTCGPAGASQGDTAGEGSTLVVSTARHRPVLGVLKPPEGERRHCAWDANTRGGDHLH